MKIILLCGNQSNQHALAMKVKQKFDLAGIVLESKNSQQKRSVAKIFSKVVERILFFKIASSWNNMLSYYKKDQLQDLKVPLLHVENINTSSVIDFINQNQPDLIMVSGTSLLRGGLLNVSVTKGIINLHTGLSPYVKGGPNCTNWCIANNTMYLVGNTIMVIDKGIDSGKIIASEVVSLDGTESINQLHIKVMESAHDLYLRALSFIEKNQNTIPGTSQNEIAEGQLYLTKMWDFKTKLRWAKNVFWGKYKKEILHPDFKLKQKEIRTIELK